MSYPNSTDYGTEYPYKTNQASNQEDYDQVYNLDYAQKNSHFDTIQNDLKEIIENYLRKTSNNVTPEEVEKVLHEFFKIGNQKNKEIKQIVDGTKDTKKAAQQIFDKYYRFLQVNFAKDQVNDVPNPLVEKRTILKKYQDFIYENTLNGKYGFFMYMYLMDEAKIVFAKSSDYLNIGSYNMFFTSDKIYNKKEVLDLFELNKSLDTTYKTLKSIIDKNICFYFGVKNDKLEYGFYDVDLVSVYKTGEFEINNAYLRSLKSYKCLVFVEDILKNININDLKLLHNIKKDLDSLYPDFPAEIKITDLTHVTKTINSKWLISDLKIENGILKYYEKWIKKFNWSSSVDFYLDDNDDDNDITFYVRIKKSETINEKMYVKKPKKTVFDKYTSEIEKIAIKIFKENNEKPEHERTHWVKLLHPIVIKYKRNYQYVVNDINMKLNQFKINGTPPPKNNTI